MFKEIKNYENYGLIDENGNIKAHNSKLIRKHYINRSDHHEIKINGRTELVRNLVFTTFISEFDPLIEEVIFIDGNRDNLHVSNLKLQTIPEKGINRGMVTGLYLKGMKVKEIAKRYKVSNTLIYSIVNKIENPI